ncbi:NAD-dependent protein deacylase [Rhodobacteraceae bacterium 2CG4]|uniref:NAD-dependent protein deacylase n=1 Tax=Halovulum marinum TaxID=2662447 RepID=A0A6L5YY72_9RHOB|nr:NAD-dependent deacylase [Halovulum marinum]MSU88949.1 NAD-dependent protein deacylase [Halovulum marinum]
MSRIVVLTGAGISAESGLATFRGDDGTWNSVRLEDVATPGAFARDPAKVHAFYNARRVQAAQAQPNAAHVALARLQAEWPDAVLLVTQNVDGLHERAGAAEVVHMHGQLDRALCAGCGAGTPWVGAMSAADVCTACGRPGGMRPDIVWFGEMPYRMELIEAALAQADLFVAIGTSGTVYPAAGFVEIAAAAGARTVELNLEPTGNPRFHEVRTGPAGEIVPAFVAGLLNRPAGGN